MYRATVQRDYSSGSIVIIITIITRVYYYSRMKSMHIYTQIKRNMRDVIFLQYVRPLNANDTRAFKRNVRTDKTLLAVFVDEPFWFFPPKLSFFFRRTINQNIILYHYRCITCILQYIILCTPPPIETVVTNSNLLVLEKIFFFVLLV